jgi:heme-degrading monooxygenase HmoA
MAALARTMPGYLSHKGFFADDGERVTIVEFEHEEGLRTWRRNPEHIAAQKLAREKYYTEYHVQVCTLDRESHFKTQETEMRAVANQTEAAK